MKRQRGRNRKPGGGGGGGGGGQGHGNNPNRAFESNGPDVKVRGSAQTIYEKYQQLARDAQTSGDRVLAENYLQHAEHYFRIFRAMQPAAPPPRQDYLNQPGYDGDDEDGDDGAENDAPDAEAEGFESSGPMEIAPQGERPPRRERFERRDRPERTDRPDRPERTERPDRLERAQPADEPGVQAAEGEGDDQGGEEGEGGARRRRRRRPFRERGEGGEAFGGQTPAFLATPTPTSSEPAE